jgi:hypothetical protein
MLIHAREDGTRNARYQPADGPKLSGDELADPVQLQHRLASVRSSALGTITGPEPPASAPAALGSSAQLYETAVIDGHLSSMLISQM